MKIGLISHLISDYNLGCSALAISNLKLMDTVFEEYKIPVEYVVILAELRVKKDLKTYTSLEGFTKNPFSYRTYPRPKNILKNPFLLIKTKAFDDCDYVIDLCGGDGYTDNYGLKRTFAESIPIFGCRFNNITSYFGPQTIGPFNTSIGKILAKLTLKKLKVIFVRDQSSFECCKNLGFEKKTLKVIDVAFALPYTKKVFSHEKFNIGINVSGLLYNGGYNYDNYFKLSFSYKEFVNKLLNKLTKDDNLRIHLVPHVIDKDKGIDDDYSVCEKLKAKYSTVILPEPFTSASDAKGYIAGLDLFSGARMHATIAATSSEVPVIPVAYSRKFNGLYDTLEYSYYIDGKAEMTVDQAVEKFLEYMNNIDELKMGIQRAKKVYKKGLEDYKQLLPKVMSLTKQ